MTWINPLDKLPQLPVDWANHSFYGGLIFLPMFLGLPAIYAMLIVLGATAIKKIFDYFKEGESLKVCVGKTIFTAIWPICVVILQLIQGI